MKPRYFLVSDTHFGHKNIIDYEQRPFNNTEEMDQYMIQKWNESVRDDDIVIHFGDVFVCNASRATEISSQLKGRKILILGNHDRFSVTKFKKMGFSPHKQYLFRNYFKPAHKTPLKLAVGNGLLIGNIHGHTHSKNDHLDKRLYKCACVEFTNYKPILFEDFLKDSTVSLN